MAHIVEFNVEGLVGRDDSYSQRLNRDVNIFFGPNGNGKTSLLKILHSAMAADSSILTNVPFKAAEVKIFSEHYGKVFTRTFKKDFSRRSTEPNLVITPSMLQPQRVLFEQSGELWNTYKFGSKMPSWKTKPQSPEQVVSWHHQYLPTSRLWIPPVASPSVAESIRTEEELDRRFQITLESLWRGYMGDVLVKVRKAQEEGLANILKWILSSDNKRLRRKDRRVGHPDRV